VAAGLPAARCEMILQAAALHDIGKIGIPDRVLLKPGKLDPDEWELMKTHTTLGAQLLSGSRSEVVQLAETIALSHHERWDAAAIPKDSPARTSRSRRACARSPTSTTL